MKRSHLYPVNDSGSFYLAEACGLPSVSFFGHELPEAYGHPSEINHIFYSNFPCSPCLNVFTNKGPQCK
jgi:ADP-heptose:LPS heptosyltransferase